MWHKIIRGSKEDLEKDTPAIEKAGRTIGIALIEV